MVTPVDKVAGDKVNKDMPMDNSMGLNGNLTNNKETKGVINKIDKVPNMTFFHEDNAFSASPFLNKNPEIMKIHIVQYFVPFNSESKIAGSG